MVVPTHDRADYLRVTLDSLNAIARRWREEDAAKATDKTKDSTVAA